MNKSPLTNGHIEIFSTFMTVVLVLYAGGAIVLFYNQLRLKLRTREKGWQVSLLPYLLLLLPVVAAIFVVLGRSS
ncbi:hypothetical protein [Serratia marcescens]|uniref:hypothetical protein n=1 Tax=Serratia marcescens TaxID=615 RepID=UPI0021BD5F41|nr:hypothetical protein [Serratia marcescens]